MLSHGQWGTYLCGEQKDVALYSFPFTVVRRPDQSNLMERDSQLKL